MRSLPTDASYDPIRIEVFKQLFAAIADEMGVILRKASYSPNIKERRDFSCAIFDPAGQMIAQAAHIPVHLGSMPLSVITALTKYKDALSPGDTIILNDPFMGGTHLPDITLVTPVFLQDGRLAGFVANRAHHADVGGISPGSMPVAREIFQEGLIIPPVKLLASGVINQGVFDLILANVRTPEERSGDIWAQVASNQRGVSRFQEMIDRYGYDKVVYYMQQLLAYSERLTRKLLKAIPDGTYSFTDALDNDGITNAPVPICVSISILDEEATIDFTGSAEQQASSVNAVYAITLSAVFYVFRCLIGLDAPNNTGCLQPLHVIAPEGSVVNAKFPAPVAAGNVETSQRIVDVLMGALAQACPEKIPAASQGTMNNLTIGGWDPIRAKSFAYYETIGGGMGARPDQDGLSALHSHMTNTLNTPIEALEYTYPLRILCYEIRQDSGGSGKFHGGDGLRRDIQALASAQATLLTERRVLSPYGLAGGFPGSRGRNLLIHNGQEEILPGKCTVDLQPGDILSICTPGGGGYGKL